MPENPHATVYVNAAYRKMLGAMTDALVPAFATYPTPGDFENADEHLTALVGAVDEYVHAVAIEAACNSTTLITTADRVSILSDALHDSSLTADLRFAAERMREDQLENA